MQMNSLFSEWGLSPETLTAIEAIGYTEPTAVQQACIPHLLTQGGDLIALARTGTGKTAAFGIPMIESLTEQKAVQALVLCPTRELARQVAQNLEGLGRNKQVRVATVLGGESYQTQIRALKSGAQILVSTPGRLLDLMEQGVVNLSCVETLILDEADEMLSFGFQEALESVWKALEGNDVKTWLFSATMSRTIRQLADTYLKTPHEVLLNTSREPSRVESFATVVFEEDKVDALTLLLKNEPQFYGIIFAGTKKQVADLEIKFRSLGLDVDSLHGDKAQADRTRVIKRFKSRQTRVLVATDVAARGLDIEDLTHVVNFEIPRDIETYTHRIGRTARAGKTGTVWTFVKPKEAHSLRKFEKALQFQFKNLQIPSVEDARSAQVLSWLESLVSAEPTPEDRSILEGACLGLLVDKGLEVSDENKEWLLKVMTAMRVGAAFNAKQPRTMQFRSDSSDDRSRAPRERSGSGRSGPDRSSRGRSPRRFDSNRSPYEGSDSDRPRRSSRPRFSDDSDSRPQRSSRPRFSDDSEGRPQRSSRPRFEDRGEGRRDFRGESRPERRSEARGDDSKPRFRRDRNAGPKREGRGERSSRPMGGGENPRRSRRK